MGGRGSSGGGKGGGGGKAVDAKMPELTGSAKQVSWAEDIRHNALANADSLVSQASDEYGLDFPGGGRVSSASAKQVRSDIVNVFQQVSSASAIIDKRGAFSMNQIRDAMYAAEASNRRKKK